MAVRRTNATSTLTGGGRTEVLWVSSAAHAAGGQDVEAGQIG